MYGPREQKDGKTAGGWWGGTVSHGMAAASGWVTAEMS